MLGFRSTPLLKKMVTKKLKPGLFTCKGISCGTSRNMVRQSNQVNTCKQARDDAHHFTSSAIIYCIRAVNEELMNWFDQRYSMLFPYLPGGK